MGWVLELQHEQRGDQSKDARGCTLCDGGDAVVARSRRQYAHDPRDGGDHAPPSPSEEAFQEQPEKQDPQDIGSNVESSHMDQVRGDGPPPLGTEGQLGDVRTQCDSSNRVIAGRAREELHGEDGKNQSDRRTCCKRVGLGHGTRGQAACIEIGSPTRAIGAERYTAPNRIHELPCVQVAAKAGYGQRERDSASAQSHGVPAEDPPDVSGADLSKRPEAGA
jgi:hypothetical protein